MTFKKYFLLELELPDGRIIRIAGDGNYLRIRGVPFVPIEVDLYYNDLEDNLIVIHERKLVRDI